MVDLVLSLLLLANPPEAVFQQDPGEPEVRVLETRVLPGATATGDEFVLEILVVVQEGWRLRAPDTLTYLLGARARGPAGISPAGRVMSGGTRLSLAYPLQAMRPGNLALPPLRARVDPDEAPPGPLDGSPAPSQSRGSNGRWVTLDLGSISLASVLPAEPDSLELAGPLSLPPAPEGSVSSLLVLALLVAGGSGVASWILNRRGPSSSHGGDPPIHPFAGRAPPLSASEARRQLSQLLAEVPGPSRNPAAELEEAYGLLRTILVAEAEGANEASTSTEILKTLEARGRGDTLVLRPLLEGGDQNRFGSDPLSDAQILYGLRGIGRWLEGPNA